MLWRLVCTLCGIDYLNWLQTGRVNLMISSSGMEPELRILLQHRLEKIDREIAAEQKRRDIVVIN